MQLQACVTIEQRGIPGIRIVQFSLQGFAWCFVEVSPGGKFSAVMREAINHPLFVGPEPNRFEHMNALRGALAQSPGKYRFEDDIL